MTKEELEKEANKYVKQNYCEMCVMADDCKSGCIDCFTVQAYVDGAEPREKRIAELEKQLDIVRDERNLFQERCEDILENYYCDHPCKCAELEAQIEKMKNCKNCLYQGECDLSGYEECKNFDKWEMKEK